jgi:hypothetical protein
MRRIEEIGEVHKDEQFIPELFWHSVSESDAVGARFVKVYRKPTARN